MDSSNQPSFLYSIGHSTHSIGKFLDLLKQHNIQTIADIRSVPYSRRNPQFSREILKESLKNQNIGYIFLGNELGARRSEPSCYSNQKVDYDQVAKTPAFLEGLGKLVNSSLKMKIAMLCAEKDPLTCHRTILVGRHIKKFVDDVYHILGDGNIETQGQAEERLLQEYLDQSSDLFANREELISDVYRRRGWDIAYKEPMSHG